MIEITIPGRGSYRFSHLILDLNGTIALDGEILKGVDERLKKLSRQLSIFIVTADTHGTAWRLGENQQAKVHKIETGNEDAQKLALIQELGKEHAVSIGNGANDASMLKESALGICVLGREGTSIKAIMSSDLVVSDISDALDLLLKPDRLVATLRR